MDMFSYYRYGSSFAMLILCLVYGITFGAGLRTDPASILTEIKEKGAKSVFGELKDGGGWLEVLNGIESGAKPWLDVAVKIHPATDAGPSEMLHLAAGVALAKNPADVLLLAIPTLPIEGVCGFSDMSDPRYDTKEKTLLYLNERIKNVRSLNQPGIAGVRDKCLDVLEKTKSEIVSPTGPFSGKSGSNNALVWDASPLRASHPTA